jgi:DNA-binding NarL/FixJ family response regulator
MGGIPSCRRRTEDRISICEEGLSYCCAGKEEMIVRDPIRVLCVDDHPLIREGIAMIVANESDMELVGEAPTGHAAIQMFREHRPDVTLMDLRLPDFSGNDALIAIREEFPDARILMLTTFDGDVEVQRALKAGARGYLLKSMPPKEILEAVRQVHAGGKRIPQVVASHLAEHLGYESLSEREIEVLRQVANGNGNREVGKQLAISEETVKVHIKHIMEKLGANDRTQAVTIAVRRGIMQL